MPPVHQHDRTARRTDLALCGVKVTLAEDITDDTMLVTCERCRVAAALRCPTCGRGITNAMYVRGQRYHRGCEPSTDERRLPTREDRRNVIPDIRAVLTRSRLCLDCLVLELQRPRAEIAAALDELSGKGALSSQHALCAGCASVRVTFKASVE